MQVAGRPSWRFAHGNGQCSDLHAALLARDAAELVVPEAPDVPPPLAADWLPGGPPPRLAAVTAAERMAAAAQWAAWWRQLVAAKVSTVHSGPPGGTDTAPNLDWAKSLYLIDPPEFGSLAATPELRTVATAAYAAWPRVPGRSGSFGRLLIRGVAEQTAADYGVPLDAVDARAHILDVQGSWWHVAGPGCVLCSPAATGDPVVAAQLLRAVFASRLH